MTQGRGVEFATQNYTPRQRSVPRIHGRLEEFLAKNLAPEGIVKVGRERVIDMPAKR